MEYIFQCRWIADHELIRMILFAGEICQFRTSERQAGGEDVLNLKVHLNLNQTYPSPVLIVQVHFLMSYVLDLELILNFLAGEA